MLHSGHKSFESFILFQWYECNVSDLPFELQTKFLQEGLDDGGRKFLQNCYDKTDAFFTQFGQMVFKGIFNLFMSVTTINGILNRGSMHIFSAQQFRSLLGVDDKWKANKLLDLGAGDGKVTEVMAPHFKEVYVTEQSVSMRWRLGWKGYTVLDIDDWSSAKESYDVIGCLNLLDRCAKPRTLLAGMKHALKPETGRVIIAVVLPFNPCVDNVISPTELITVVGETWEEQVISLVEDVFTPAGYEVERFTRLPYLCEGDLYDSFYSLSDTVFVLKPVENSKKTVQNS
ncbi:predicted protein [Nematostella vectensis]|uniref:Methyltransferase-like protein 9 n=1 Tax=Nematostella vectensis TaxID=45351 RepID=A7SGS8_NEMVE|nr:predicted protein [Nematostella vectensis]|eukprot:XP_001629123.1 predicted protein [Nematostella vectensis]